MTEDRSCDSDLEQHWHTMAARVPCAVLTRSPHEADKLLHQSGLGEWILWPNLEESCKCLAGVIITPGMPFKYFLCESDFNICVKNIVNEGEKTKKPDQK